MVLTVTNIKLVTVKTVTNSITNGQSIKLVTVVTVTIIFSNGFNR